MQTENYLLSDVVVVASAATRVYGFVSKSRAFSSPGMLVATSDRVKAHFNATEDFPEDLLEITEADLTECKEAIQWAKQQFKIPDKDSEFEAKLHNVLYSDSGLEHLNIGIAACIPNLYQKYQRKKVEESLDIIDEYFGAVGDKIEIQAYLFSVSSFDRSFSTAYIHKFIDSEGHLFVWWANTKNPWNPGETYRFSAEISKHSEFNGQYQTTLKFLRKVKEKKDV